MRLSIGMARRGSIFVTGRERIPLPSTPWSLEFMVAHGLAMASDDVHNRNATGSLPMKARG
jgi:hypothetical protein